MAAKLYFMFWCVDIVVATSICYTKIEGLIVWKKSFFAVSLGGFEWQIALLNVTPLKKGRNGSDFLVIALLISRLIWRNLVILLLEKNIIANLIIFQRSFFSLKNMVLLYLLICSSIVYCAWFRPTKTSDKNPTCVSADLAFVAVDQ